MAGEVFLAEWEREIVWTLRRRKGDFGLLVAVVFGHYGYGRPRVQEGIHCAGTQRFT